MKDDVSGWLILMVFVWLCTVISVEPAIYPESVKQAEELCADNGGWKKIEEGYSSYSSLVCNNGAEFQYGWKPEWVK